MAKMADMKMEVTLDRQARDSIRSLVNALDRLSAAVVNGDDVGTLASEVEHVETLRRLVEDVKANRPRTVGEQVDDAIFRGVAPERRFVDGTD